MTNQLIALDPELGITAADFAQAWNEHAKTREIGQMSSTNVPPTTFHDPAALIILTTMIGIASSVLSAAIYDLLKDKYGLNKETKIVEIEQADGTKIIIVKVGD